MRLAGAERHVLAAVRARRRSAPTDTQQFRTFFLPSMMASAPGQPPRRRAFSSRTNEFRPPTGWASAFSGRRLPDQSATAPAARSLRQSPSVESKMPSRRQNRATPTGVCGANRPRQDAQLVLGSERPSAAGDWRVRVTQRMAPVQRRLRKPDP